MNRREDLDRFYGIIDILREKCQGFRYLKDCTRRSGWPERGLYLFFEDHEFREDGNTLRVTRVGTHAVSTNSRTTLWTRLHTHKGASTGGGNHRGSIFRKRVGEALLQIRDYSPEIGASWGIGNSAARSTRLAEAPLERDVSAMIGLMPFLWLEVNDTPGAASDRAYLERNCIGLLSNYERKQSADLPKAGWVYARHRRQYENLDCGTRIMWTTVTPRRSWMFWRSMCARRSEPASGDVSGVSGRNSGEHSMFVAGVDGCRGGWVAFKVELATRVTSVEVVDLHTWLRERPPDLACVGIDIPIGLLDGSRACDKAARKLLGQPRGSSVFAAPCRAALSAKNYREANAINLHKTGRGLSQQAWGIIPKIKQVDDAITLDCQQWAFEAHPEVCFWALNQCQPMTHNKKTREGSAERISVLRVVFPEIERHLANRPSRVGADDILDAAATAWSALRWHRNESKCVCSREHDEKGLMVGVCY